jgi:ABC-type glycerol-3-phosphate transport system substrate-binding protein
MGAVGLAAACGGAAGEAPAQSRGGGLKPATVSLRVTWNPGVVPWNERLPKLRDAFAASHPGWDLEWFFAAGDFVPDDKLVSAIAAGEPPDAMVVGGQVVPAWATRGLVQPIDAQLGRARIGEAEYWTPSWRQHIWKGKTWALPFNSDANFAMLASKQVFEEAGLNPDKAPQTIGELDDMHRRLTKRDGGQLVRLGIHPPWDTYGRPNSMYTWGWVFGGEFYDEKAQKVTADHPQVVKALEWLVDWTKRSGGYDEVEAFRRSFQPREQSPIFVGQIGMRPVHGGYAEDIDRYAPTFRFTFDHLPAGPAPARPRASWVGGWSLGLTGGSKQPDHAWELMRWLSQSAEATTWLGREVGWYPALKKAPFWEVVQKDPKRAIFYEILKEARHQRPVMPASGEYGDLLDKAVLQAIRGEQAPRVLLQEVTREAQRLLDERLRTG